MCLVCLDLDKLTVKEARRNFSELNAPHTDEELEELERLLYVKSRAESKAAKEKLKDECTKRLLEAAKPFFRKDDDV